MGDAPCAYVEEIRMQADGNNAGFFRGHRRFECTPDGPFNLAQTKNYFGGWLSFGSDQSTIAMAFPVEGWRGSVAVILRQDEGGTIIGEVHGAAEDAEMAWQQ